MKVELARHTHNAPDLVASAARTCTGAHAQFSTPADLQKRIVPGTFNAGHHTLFEYPDFVFVLTGISRRLVWLLHDHPYYNSSQQSQRWVTASRSYHVPYFEDNGSTALYKECAELMFNTYSILVGLLEPVTYAAVEARFPNRREGQLTAAATRYAQEVARYILPLAAHTNLYHKVSAVTIMRLWRVSQEGECAKEFGLLASKMLGYAEQITPLIFDSIGPPNDPIPMPILKDDVVWWDVAAAASYIEGSGAPETLVDTLTNIRKKEDVRDALQVYSISKRHRLLAMWNLSYAKVLSHTADSQDQRHRTIPGCRPNLVSILDLDQPAYIIPTLLKAAGAEAALSLYKRTMESVWASMRLLSANAERDDTAYLLPNAFPVPLLSNGTVADHLHKWRLRLCLNAQEEIWRVTKQEVAQSGIPADLVGPPCRLRYLRGIKPYCPEGPRFCGKKVWKGSIDETDRSI